MLVSVAAMEGNGAVQWDETICSMVACQHPPCWESVQRVESGCPRVLLGKKAAPPGASTERKDKLPTLKILDLPFKYSPRKNIRSSENVYSIYRTVSNIKEARSFSTLSEGSSGRNAFPGLNSRMESCSPHFLPMQVTNLTELMVDELSYQPFYGNLVVKWVPDTRHRFLQPEKPVAGVMASNPRMCIKDLTLEGSLSLKDNKVMEKKKSNKVPTGGQPYTRHLRESQKLLTNKSCSVGEERSPKDSLTKERQFPPRSLHLAPLVPPPKKGDHHPESRRERLLLESKGKLTAPFIVQKAPSFYRSEAKILVEEKGSRLGQGQPKVPAGGSPDLRRLGSDMVEQPHGNQDRERWDFPKHSPLPLEVSTKNCKPPKSPRADDRRKASVKFVKYRSSAARLGMEGHDQFASCISKVDCRYREYPGLQ